MHAQVVGQSAVQKVQVVDLPEAVGPVAQVIGVTRQLEGVQVQVGRETALEPVGDPGRHRSAGAVLGREIAKGDRREDDRHRRRGGHAAGDGLGIQVAADVVEALRREGKDLARGHVGGVQDQVGLARLVQVGKGLVLEQLAVQQLLDQVAARRPGQCQTEPGHRVERLQPQAAGVVRGQKIGLETVQPRRAVQRKVGRNHAAARDRGQHRNVVGQGARAAVAAEVAVLGQLTQHHPAQGRRARAAA